MKTMKPTILHNFLFSLTICAVLIIPSHPTSTRPDPENAPVFARWLVNQGSWGVLATLDQRNEPFGNVMSYTDAGTGVPYFYLTTTLDPTGINALRRSQSSFTLCESVLGYCATDDTQSPVCAKITLSGNLILLPENTKEAAFAKAAFFASHPQFKGFPLNNGSFYAFKLVIKKIFLLNKYAPPRVLTVYDYFHPKV